MADRHSRTTRQRNPRSTSASSTSPSPSRRRPSNMDADDASDVESFNMMLPNDSASSLGMTDSMSDSLAREVEERCRLSPISRLPTELMIAIFHKLPKTWDLRSCMLVSRDWARCAVGLLWHRPSTSNWPALQMVVRTLCAGPKTTFDYEHLIKRLNLSALDVHVSNGTLLPFQNCKRVERLTLTNCSKLSDFGLTRVIEGNRALMALDVTNLSEVTDKTMEVVARNCFRLQGLNISGCRGISDEALEAVARSCRHLKRLKFNGCNQLTDKSIIAIARHCRQILEVDLADCRKLEDDAVTALISEGANLRELHLTHCVKITDNAFLNLPFGQTYENLRILDLTDCVELQDAGVQKVIECAPRLRNLLLNKCRHITDRAITAITKLGKNLHFIHLGHCSRITDAGVNQLVRICNRIRYIDLACCTNLTDTSVMQLATLPKLKRIGLVKCHNITDLSIYALAKPRYGTNNGAPASPGGSSSQPSALERVHLSYCTNLTLDGITALLNNCPRLSHLSLTGVQAFLREDLLVFCREPPPEFNDHQRDVFCVFSNNGVTRLREYLNQHHDAEANTALQATEGTAPDAPTPQGQQGPAQALHFTEVFRQPSMPPGPLSLETVHARVFRWPNAADGAPFEQRRHQVRQQILQLEQLQPQQLPRLDQHVPQHRATGHDISFVEPFPMTPPLLQDSHMPPPPPPPLVQNIQRPGGLNLPSIITRRQSLPNGLTRQGPITFPTELAPLVIPPMVAPADAPAGLDAGVPRPDGGIVPVTGIGVGPVGPNGTPVQLSPTNDAPLSVDEGEEFNETEGGMANNPFARRTAW